MAKKKTAKKEAPVTADVEIVEEFDATRYTPWVPDNMPIGGKSNSTEQLNDHPTEHNHSAEAIGDIVDRFADLRLYVPAANSCGVDGDLQVDGQTLAQSGTAALPGIAFTSSAWSGFYYDASTIHTSVQGQSRLQVGVAGTKVTGDLQVDGHTQSWSVKNGNGNLSAPSYSFYNDPTTGLFRQAEGVLGVAGDLRAFGNLQVDGQTLAQNGERSAPAYSFTSRPGTGMSQVVGGLEFSLDGELAAFFGNKDGAAEFKHIRMPGIGYQTINATGNVVFNAANGLLYQSVSASAFMREIEAVNLDARNSVYDLKPIWYRSTCSGDDPTLSHYGFAAEDVAAVDPRLATYDTDDETGETTATNVNSNAMIALLVSAVQEQQATISDLTARVEALEANA